MPRGGKKAKIAAEPSKVQDLDQSAVRDTEKDVQDDIPETSGNRRSKRIRARKSASTTAEKDQLSLQQSHQVKSKPKRSTFSRPGASTVPDSEGDTASAKPPTKKDQLTAPKSQKSRQISTGSKFKPISEAQKKATARLSQQSEEDLTSQTQKFPKGNKRQNPKRSGAPVAKANKKTTQVKAKSSDFALAPSVPVPGDKSSRRGRRKESELPEGHQALSREALERLSRNLESVRTARDEESIQTSGTTYTDPREEFNYRYGYLPPLDEEASRIIEAIISNPDLITKMARIGPGSQALFKTGLLERNVEIEPSKSVDLLGENIKSLSLGDRLRETAEQKHFCEYLWLQDKARLGADSNEAIFQRTLMVSLIARHFLIYEQEVNGEPLLDFSAEELWTCLPMPSKALWDAGPGLDVDAKLLTQPKPDLAVCFKREAIIKHDLWKVMPEATKELACFENRLKGSSRIFHFLTVEAKNATVSLTDTKALYQSLNNASQALNNFHEFFQDAGPIHKQIFFDKVRFFSIVANSQGILIRIHKAVEIPQDANPFALIMPDRPEYRLSFEYREFARLTGEEEFTRDKVVEILRKVFKYAVDELSAWISAAAKDLVDKMGKDFSSYQARRKLGFYRHGQPAPKTSKNTPRTSRASSKSGRASPLTEQLLNAKTVSLGQSFVEESTNGQHTPKAKDIQQNSQLSTGSNKRTLSQIEIESMDSEEPRVTEKRSRKAAAKRKH